MGKISKKYIGADQVGSVQIELENGDALRSKNSGGVSVDLMELDPSNLLQILQQPFLPGNAVSNLQAIPKQQLDSAVSSIGSDIAALQAEDLTFVKLDGSRPMTGDLSMMPVLGTHYRITGLNDPSDPRDAANKQYVDSVAEGLHVHAPVTVIINQTLEAASGGSVVYDNGVSGVGATLVLSVPLTAYDTYTFQNSDRVIVNGQANSAYNGIYTVGTNGTLGSVFTRALDFNTPAEIAGGDFVFVQYGTLGANTGWVEPLPVASVGVDPITFIQFSGAGTYVAGDGLVLLGNEFNVKADLATSTTEINSSNQIAVKLDPAGQLSTSGAGIAISSAFQGRMSTAESNITALQTGKANINLDNLAAGDTSIPAGVDLRSLETDQSTGFRLSTANQATLQSGAVQVRTGSTVGPLSGSTFIIPGLNSNAAAGTYNTAATGSGLLRSGTITGGTKGATGSVAVQGGGIVSSAVTGITGPIYVESGANAGLGGTGFMRLVTGFSTNASAPAPGEGSSDTGTFIAGSGKSLAGVSGGVYISSGEIDNSAGFNNLASTQQTGVVSISSGYNNNTSSSAKTGDAFFGSGSHAGSGITGNLLVASGGNYGLGSTGIAEILSGIIFNAASSADSGFAQIRSGDNAGAGKSGDVYVASGNNSGTGNSGNIQLFAGSVVSGTRGYIQLVSRIVEVSSEIDMTSHKIINVTDPTANQDAATKYYVDNALSSTGANRSLSNLIAPTAINESLLPGVSLGVSLGAASLSFADAFLDSIKDDSGLPAFSVSTRILFDAVGNHSIDLESRLMVASDASDSIDYQARELYSSDSNVSVAYDSKALYDAAGPSIDWGSRQLFASDATTIVLDFSSNVGISANTHKITDVVDPTAAQDAATKAYVDSKIASGTNFLKQIVTLSSTDISNGYVDLASEHLPESTVIGVGQRVNLYETLDYTLSVVSSVTRVTFAGPSAVGGAEELVDGDILYIQGVQA